MGGNYLMSLTAHSSLKSEEPKEKGYFKEGNNLDTLGDIYQEDTNMVIWKRELDNAIQKAANVIIDTNPSLEISRVVSPDDTYAEIRNALGFSENASIISKDVANLVDMFCTLFDLKQVGLRLAVLDRAMCPRFHVDRVPCRLLTTYLGVATEWLPHHNADRSRLGIGNQGKPDEESGIMNSDKDIKYLNQGDVALLKGEAWEGNEGSGLIHRSPTLDSNSRRLLLTIDFIDS